MTRLAFKYFLPEHGMTEEDAFEVESAWSSTFPHRIAQDAAEDYWNNHDGWEGDWPKIIVVVIPGATGENRRFEVSVESRPDFYAVVGQP